MTVDKKPVVNDILECVQAGSRWYIPGKKYKVVKDIDGNLCVQAEDGLLDIVSMTVSKFRKVGRETAVSKSKG